MHGALSVLVRQRVQRGHGMNGTLPCLAPQGMSCTLGTAVCVIVVLTATWELTSSTQVAAGPLPCLCWWSCHQPVPNRTATPIWALTYIVCMPQGIRFFGTSNDAIGHVNQ
jgi:hypothetical protein